MEQEHYPIEDLYNIIHLSGRKEVPSIREIYITLNNGNFIYEVSYGIPGMAHPKFFRLKDRRGLNKEADDLQERLMKAGLKPVSDNKDERNFSRRVIFIE